MTRTLITGGAGFIGSHLGLRLLAQGDEIVVLDDLDPFYDVEIKRRRLDLLEESGGDRFKMIPGDIREPDDCRLALSGVDAVVHLAALAGVRPSLAEPERYMDVNVRGTQVLLDSISDEVQRGSVLKFIFGGSSSVYGGNTKVPFAEDDAVDHPVSPYAASKRAGELIAYTFHHLTGVPVTCLRFFTVFGEGQRPEMAIHKFCRMIMAGQKLPFFGDGTTRRDYTYVSDIVDGILAAIQRASGYNIYNLGGSQTTTLADLVAEIEQVLGKKAELDRMPEQPGDVQQTYADISRAAEDLSYHRQVTLTEGLRRFATWYLAEREAGLIR